MFVVIAANEAAIMESVPAIGVDPVDPMLAVLRGVRGQCTDFDCAII